MLNITRKKELRQLQALFYIMPLLLLLCQGKDPEIAKLEFITLLLLPTLTKLPESS